MLPIGLEPMTLAYQLSTVVECDRAADFSATSTHSTPRKPHFGENRSNDVELVLLGPNFCYSIDIKWIWSFIAEVCR